MSHAIDEVYEVYDERTRTANKPHTCCACGETIAKGHVYWRIGVVWQGEPEEYKRCLKCQAMHEHLRTLDPGEMWPDEQLACGLDYEQEWGEPPPPEVAALSFMSQEEAQHELAPGVRRG